MASAYATTVTAGVLAAGFGPADHPATWERLGGMPLVDHVVRRLRRQTARVLVHMEPSAACASTGAFEVVAAGTTDPLGAVQALLRAARTEFLLLVPGDTPLLPTDLAARLLAAIGPEDDCVLADDGLRIRPLFALLRCSCLSRLEQAERIGGRGAYRWLEPGRYRRVDFSDRIDGFVRPRSMPRMAL